MEMRRAARSKVASSREKSVDLREGDILSEGLFGLWLRSGVCVVEELSEAKTRVIDLSFERGWGDFLCRDVRMLRGKTWISGR